jgi:flavin reductase (DIM6/NTAB) family NADH-FMN oxidoreductase RutF
VPVSSDQFRSALRRWASGVSIVTTRRPGGIHGITVSSFCSLSLDPPLVVICIDRDARSHDLIRAQGAFAVNVLRDDQRRLSDLAAGRGGEQGCHLDGVQHTPAVTGAPVLRDCLAWLDCALVAEHAGGDHTMFVGRVEAAGQRDGRPLLWFGGDYSRLARHAGPGKVPAREQAAPRAGTRRARPRAPVGARRRARRRVS